MTEPSADAVAARRRTRGRTALRLAAYVVVWLVLAIGIGGWSFVHSERAVVVATHDALVSPTLDHHATLDLGPYLPDLRVPTSSRVGAHIVLGKTTATSTEELMQRYAALAVTPRPEIAKVSSAVKGMAIDAAIRGGVLALVPIAGWLVLGAKRRRRLLRPAWRPAAVVVTATALVVVVVWTPWRVDPEKAAPAKWIAVQDALPEVAIPSELDKVQVEGGLLSSESQRLIGSGFRAYANGKTFYKRLADQAPEYADQLHDPGKGQTVAVLVSDRHDNNGMDPVVRAFADEADATAIIDAGDDTSTGGSWEQFSLDSLDDAFDDKPFKAGDHRIAIAGNHDHGSFVSKYLKSKGWTHLDGEPVTVFDDVRMLGVDDPRSSGLGDWRDSLPGDWDKIKEKLADTACDADDDGDRISTVVVHDANLAKSVLDRGCADLVVAGHVHTQIGPTRVVGDKGVGYSYTNGTTGGAAYAVAIGSKLRRDAEITFVTYAKGRPVGIQPVVFKTNGVVQVADYEELDLG